MLQRRDGDRRVMRLFEGDSGGGGNGGVAVFLHRLLALNSIYNLAGVGHDFRGFQSSLYCFFLLRFR